MNTYIFLGGAIVAEVIGTTFMKYSEGFTRLWPSVGTAISYCAAFYLLSQTLENIRGLTLSGTKTHVKGFWS
ncbi:multidrug transporter EmrE [Klebsiella pneumoniae]|nr:multidrug transporter EmrE [Klebsiella pneumoniae]